MPGSSPALQVRGLVKRFDRPVVNHLDLSVRAGEFVFRMKFALHSTEFQFRPILSLSGGERLGNIYP